MTQQDLVPVHGGLDELVDRTVPLTQRKDLEREAKELPAVVVAKADLATLYRVGDGALSPLEGPMRRDVYQRVLDEKCVLSRGKKYAWGIPLALPVTDAEASAAKGAKAVAARNEAGELVGILTAPEVFAWEKAQYVERVYLTKRTDHPGARIATDDPRTKLLGGDLRVLPQVKHPEYAEFMLSPRVTRAFIRDKKWQRALAFQTRNPLHRAHEYALVCGAERLTAAGHYTGVVLNPLVGELKGDDVPAVMRMRCYRELHAKKLLGQGDKDASVWAKAGYDISEVFELIGLDIKMFYGGPSEALMHAVYRQNYGFSDLVIGRKHADAPYDDGSAIWGDFDAQEIFDKLPGELHTKPVKIGFAAYYESIGRVDLTENHPNEKPYSISGTKLREQLKAGEHPDARIIRPEISEILISAYKQA
jgi:sulfate adenylyltransferase